MSSAVPSAARSHPLVTDGGHPSSTESEERSSNRLVLYAAVCLSFPLAAVGNALYGPGGEFVGLFALIAYAIVTWRGESDVQ